MPDQHQMVAAGNPIPARTTTRSRILVAASIGNALEFYDFLVYAFFATSIAEVFFPGHDRETGLLLAFGTFGVSFLARPVGALVIGHYADRRGRAAAMTLSIALMTLGGLMIAIMPGERQIGLLAPLGILLARLVQGFSLGGEFGGSTAFMIEHSPAGEAQAASWQGTSQLIGGMTASGAGWILSHLLSPASFESSGFRIAFGIGVLVGPIGLLLRRGLQEAPSFLADQRRARQASPDDRADLEKPTLSGILMAIGIVALGTGLTYLIVYLPTYATQHLHMTARSSLGVVFLLYVAQVAMTPLRLGAARRFDLTHDRRAMMLSVLLMAGAGYPAFMLIDAEPGALTLFLVPVLLELVGIFYLSTLHAMMGMMFTVRRRGIGLSVGYASGVALFGGFAPFINTWLVGITGNPRSPGLYLAATGLVTLAALAAAGRRLPARAT